MKHSLQQFKQSAVYRDALQGKLAHSVMLISSDQYALDSYAEYLIATLMCTGEDKPCGECNECHKIKHRNNVDVQYFPKNNKTINSAEIAELLDSAFQSPYASDKKIFVLSGANLIDANMQNKLLKTLEEPPKDTFFLLLVTEDNNVLPTIKSRCRKWFLPKIDAQEIADKLAEYHLDTQVEQQVLDYCDGNCSLALKYASNKEFGDLVNFVQSLLTTFRKSSQMIDFAPKLYKMNENFEDFLTILLKNIGDAVNIWCGEKSNNPIANALVRDFSVDALVNIVYHCGEIIEKRARNCNYNAMVDSFLFMILEVRHKWPI